MASTTRVSNVREMPMRITLYKEELTICKLKPGEQIDEEIWKALTPMKFFSITQTLDEISIILPSDEHHVFVDRLELSRERYRMMRIEGQLDLDMVGVLANIAVPLKEAKIPILVIGTFDTDYILVNEGWIGLAIEIINQRTNFVVHQTTNSLQKPS